ncbi:MAG: hypothetical protein GWO02_07030 [Gammaproteobacteria bacterium]|nr:hypothetical protein [Gammaproteobacteria bacterium]
MAIPDRQAQIEQTHAELIHGVVAACENPERGRELEPALQASEANGWVELVARIRKILEGRRDEHLLAGLDDEDRAIVAAILRGLQDPRSLPARDQPADPSAAAPGLAALIHDAARGDTEALSYLGNMAEQMSQVGGDMARLSAILRRLVNGERDPEALTQDMGRHGETLVLSILEELGRHGTH